MKRKAALITGASSGIGVHYACELAKYGYNLVLVSNQDEELKEAARKIATANDVVINTICKDLSGQSAAQEIFNFCQENEIEVEVLVNNAGIFFFKDIIDCPIESISTMLNLHMYTVTMLCRLFGQKMRERRKGYILNMSSISVHTPYPGISLYTATKSFIRTMSKAFRLEMKEFGVRVMVVSPGAVATNLYNLPANLQQLGVSIGVIFKPDRLAKKAIYKLFNSNKKEYIPGFINHFFKPVYAILPQWFKMWVRGRIAPLMR